MTPETIQERAIRVNSADLAANSWVNPHRDTLRGTADRLESNAPF